MKQHPLADTLKTNHRARSLNFCDTLQILALELAGSHLTTGVWTLAKTHSKLKNNKVWVAVGIAPYMAMELCIFDLLSKDVPPFVRGFTAALISTTACYPLDTIRCDTLSLCGTSPLYSDAAALVLKRKLQLVAVSLAHSELHPSGNIM